MSNYTPGPWNVNRKRLGAIEHTAPSGLVDTVAFTSGDTSGSPSANARLIAAAPELFAIVLDEASLYAGMDADEFAPSTAARIKAMRSIIAKVTGETNQ